jgi:hypothetical protein
VQAFERGSDSARSGRLDRKIVGAQDWASPDMTAYINSLLNEK